MSLSDLASLGSFVSGAAVLASLVFLFFQMRQMTEQVRQAEKNQQALIHQGRTAQTTERILRYAEPGFTRVFLKMSLGREPLPDEIEVQQYAMLSSVTYREMQDVFFQHDLGLLDDAAITNHLAALQGNLTPASGKALWRCMKVAYDP